MKIKLPIHPLTLRFPEELEHVFFDDYFHESLKQVRFALLIAIFFYAISVILEFRSSPETLVKLLFLRYAIILPFLIAFFLFTFYAGFKPVMQVTLSLLIIGITLSFIGFAIIKKEIDVDEAGLLILIFSAYTVIKLFFLPATFVGWSIVSIYNIVALSIVHPSLSILEETNFHLLLANILGMVTNYLMEYYIRRDFFQARLLAEEGEKVERLLLNILPQPIAERLKNETITIADSFAEVTIMFADIVGFTPLAARLSATEIVNLLNQIFSAFDQLAERHDLEKIKTIGDAYMVVGGLPTPRANHAEAIAEMALDMQQEIARFNGEINETFSIRIGINTGPVVAGVIGLKRSIYDLWGDAVNIASRMESHGLPNCIQVSQATYELLRDKYVFEERGVIDVKGKGEMFTYLLIGRKVSE
jgi:class 3 adenylate cyclase